MIRYALQCASDHAFEAWFGSSADYDDQSARGLVECPFCGTRDVNKQIMAPAVSGTRKADDGQARLQTLMMQAARGLRAHVEANFDPVGDRFAAEARAIHEGRAEPREIYGRATPKEVRELKADGIPVAPLPDLPPDPDKTH